MMNLIRAFSFLAFVVLSLTTCRQNTRAEEPNEVSAQPAEEANTAAARQWLQISQDHAIPVYESFEGLAPIFGHSGDTTYVINFWATWCKPCVEELPFFTRLHDDYATSKVRVILVSLDFKRDLEDQLAPFIRERQLKPEVMVLLDGNYNDWIDRVDPSWGGAIPGTLVYKGRQRHFQGEKFASYEQLKALVVSLL